MLATLAPLGHWKKNIDYMLMNYDFTIDMM
jgi:hypothetical protein